ncbi:glycosyltransferase [uncultured Pseudodesulfovibrio sp.]|uniref:glycosyltransferase n=1 Tax=uncultured Pseudodesulfovibrio sp. TaxID=2035858 RepID=UPI0029C84CB9|nr:glycosyltransferase [uncultured Pseudodesulfovibrio sp.]
MLNISTEFATLGTLIQIAMAVHVLGILILLLLTKSFMRRAAKRDTPFAPPANAPATLMIIPASGTAQAIEPGLRSLLEQDYPNYRVQLVTASKDEPAAQLIKKLCKEYPHAHHVVAGNATRCCQKNQNLLAGLSTINKKETILVFCDATHLAQKDFLARLTAPIAHGKALMTSGYRFFRPMDDNIGTLTHTFSVQSIHMLQAVKPITQPWGGATAIDRATFFDNNIPNLWSRTIVDDFTMGPYLQKQGIRSLPVAEACLETRLSGQTCRNWNRWFFRQLQYLKFGMPLTWIGATIIPLIFLTIAAYTAFAFTGALGTSAAIASALYIAGLAMAGALYTRVIPNTAPLGKRLAAFFLLHVSTALGYLRTWQTNEVVWHNIRYRTRLGGEVVEIIRPRKDADS